MNEFYLNSSIGKNPKSPPLEQGVAKTKNSDNPPAQKVSFQEVLKSAVDKTGGAPEIRQDLVNKYKVSLANGTYEVKARELAEKMIQKIRENKSQEIL